MISIFFKFYHTDLLFSESFYTSKVFNNITKEGDKEIEREKEKVGGEREYLISHFKFGLQVKLMFNTFSILMGLVHLRLKLALHFYGE